LHPAIKRGTQKRKYGFRHALMFEAEIGFDQRSVLAQPFFVVLCRFDNIHRGLVGHDRTAAGKCQRRQALETIATRRMRREDF
jgi:hypothetical protein